MGFNDGLNYSKLQMENKIISYKAFYNDLTCFNYFQYEIGKTYTTTSDIKCCVHGFHACPEPAAVFNYYNIYSSRFAIVKQSGIFDIYKDKICSSKIKIIKELSLKELIEHEISWIDKNFNSLNTSTLIEDSAENVCNNTYISVRSLEPAKITTTKSSVSSQMCNADLRIMANSTKVYSSGNSSKINLEGNYSKLFSLGHDSNIQVLGNCSQIISFGNNSIIYVLGTSTQIAITGTNCILYILGKYCYIKVSLGTTIIYVNTNEKDKVKTLTRIVDGKDLKPNIEYVFLKEKFIACE